MKKKFFFWWEAIFFNFWKKISFFGGGGGAKKFFWGNFFFNFFFYYYFFFTITTTTRYYHQQPPRGTFCSPRAHTFLLTHLILILMYILTHLILILCRAFNGLSSLCVFMWYLSEWHMVYLLYVYSCDIWVNDNNNCDNCGGFSVPLIFWQFSYH